MSNDLFGLESSGFTARVENLVAAERPSPHEGELLFGELLGVIGTASPERFGAFFGISRDPALSERKSHQRISANATRCGMGP
jgi:hypothetical protein